MKKNQQKIEINRKSQKHCQIKKKTQSSTHLKTKKKIMNLKIWQFTQTIMVERTERIAKEEKIVQQI